MCKGRIESYFTNGRRFCVSACNVEFINSAKKIRVLLGTSEFFLNNATNADFM